MAVIEVLSVRRTVLPTSPRTARTKTTAMTITPESGGSSLNIPYAPQEVSHTDLIADYVTVPRPGLIENVVYSNPQRPKMTFDLELYDKKITRTNAGGSVTLVRAISVIQALQNMARKGTRVRIAYGALESGLWFITSMQVKTTHRDPITDEVTGAMVGIEALRGDSSLSGTGTGSGPVTGGATTTTKPIASTTATIKTPPTKAPGAPAARYYTTKSGDTLIGISLKFYGVTTKWTTIAAANHISDPRKLPVGKKLRVP